MPTPPTPTAKPEPKGCTTKHGENFCPHCLSIGKKITKIGDSYYCGICDRLLNP